MPSLWIQYSEWHFAYGEWVSQGQTSVPITATRSIRPILYHSIAAGANAFSSSIDRLDRYGMYALQFQEAVPSAVPIHQYTQHRA